MLILTRRTGEALKIGDEVTVKILGIKSVQVRIGIDAPRTIPVHREEIAARIKSDQAAAQAQVPPDAALT
jgi:carbon storage regulator